jgi:hypothetical protein
LWLLTVCDGSKFTTAGVIVAYQEETMPTSTTNVPTMNRVLSHIRTELQISRLHLDRALASLGAVDNVLGATAPEVPRPRALARRRPARRPRSIARKTGTVSPIRKQPAAQAKPAA